MEMAQPASNGSRIFGPFPYSYTFPLSNIGNEVSPMCFHDLAGDGIFKGNRLLTTSA